MFSQQKHHKNRYRQEAQRGYFFAALNFIFEGFRKAGDIMNRKNAPNVVVKDTARDVVAEDLANGKV